MSFTLGAWLETPVGRASEMWHLWNITIWRATSNVSCKLTNVIEMNHICNMRDVFVGQV